MLTKCHFIPKGVIIKTCQTSFSDDHVASKLAQMKWKLKLDNDHLCEGGMLERQAKWKHLWGKCG